jgi:hypothetical protein
MLKNKAKIKRGLPLHQQIALGGKPKKPVVKGVK